MADVAQKVEETPAEINFEDAFARLAELEEGKQPDLTEPQPAQDEKPSVDEPQPAETAEETESEAEKPSEPAPEPAPAAAKPNEDEVLRRLARLVEEKQPEQPAPQPAQQQPQIYSADEQEFLASYEKEWPDVSRAESLRRRAEYRELVGYVLTEFAKELRPLAETVQVLSQRTHLSDLKSTVEDYDTVRDNVISWVEQQPTYLQVAYKHVIENGTVDEVADLVGRYKRETGASATPASAPAARRADTELPSATKQAAAALAPVSSKRSAVVQASDPDDFESAFASFASKM
jgi:hypothetical protein